MTKKSLGLVTWPYHSYKYSYIFSLGSVTLLNFAPLKVFCVTKTYHGGYNKEWIPVSNYDALLCLSEGRKTGGEQQIEGSQMELLQSLILMTMR